MKLILLSVLAIALNADVLYVSTEGKATWSGRLASPNAARTDGPLPSLEAARDAVRRNRAAEPNKPFTVILRGGTYRLERPFVLTNADSNVTYEATPGERAVLSGGRTITGWKKSKEQIWTAPVPSGWTPRQLFIGQRRARRARIPNNGYLRIIGPSSQETPFRLPYRDGLIRKTWAGAQVEVVALLGWTSFRRPVAAVNEEAQVATLAGGPGGSAVGIVQDPEGRFFIENAPEALDEQGEWYLDRRASTISYWPLGGEDPAAEEITGADLTRLVVIEGRPGALVRGVTLRGLHFRHADWSMPPEGYADQPQAAVNEGAAVEADGAEGCVIERCTFSQIGNYAIWFRRASKSNRVAHNAIFDAGAGGIKLGEKVIRETEADRTFGNALTDNHIHDLGHVHPEAVGIWLGQTGRNTVAHNLIHHVYYSGISAGWTWGYGPSLCEDNRIEFNEVHHIGRDTLNDLGGIYTLGYRGGTVRNNIVHDVRSFAERGRGIYLDEGTVGTLVESNIVYRAKSSGFHLHYGRDNIVRNNILALNEEAQASRARSEQHRSFTFTRNIVYWNSGRPLGGNWGAGVDVESNLYFDPRGGDPRFGRNSLVQWRELGRDTKSIVADPMFMDAARSDFRLHPDSPAWKLGFVAIDVAAVGPRP